MSTNKIINLPDPSTDTEPVTKKYADANYSGGGVTKKYVDDKFVEKTKITTEEWMWGYVNVGSAYTFPYHAFGWPSSVRTDKITDNTNIELRNITFDDEVTKAQILASTLVVSMRCVTNAVTYEKDIITESLAGKTRILSPLNAKETTFSSTVILNIEYWLGNLIPTTRHALGFSIRIKVTGLPSSTVGPEVLCLFRLNESGQFG